MLSRDDEINLLLIGEKRGANVFFVGKTLTIMRSYRSFYMQLLKLRS